MRKIISTHESKKNISFKTILWLFVGFKIIDFVIILLAPVAVPYLGFFPYKEIVLQYNLPHVFSAFANFDGVQYLIIAKEGYYTYNQAYFPLYPLIIKYTSVVLFGNYLLSALILSNAAFLAGLYFFKRYLETFIKDPKIVFFILLFLLTFPTSFFFEAVYTEGVFFFLFCMSLYFFRKKNTVASAFTGFFTSVTRLLGIFLLIPYSTELIYRFKQQKMSLRFIIPMLTPIVGLMVYMGYLWKTTNDPLFFYHSQPAFGANRSTHIILVPQVLFRYIKIFITSDWNFQYFTSIIEFTIFLFVVGILLFQLYKLIKGKKDEYFYILLGLNLFSLGNIVLPTFTGTLSSIPRYALFSLSFFIFLGTIKNKYIQWVTVGVFSILHIVLLSFFAQGYFVS